MNFYFTYASKILLELISFYIFCFLLNVEKILDLKKNPKHKIICSMSRKINLAALLIRVQNLSSSIRSVCIRPVGNRQIDF